ncbi:1-deoxy-D-xylulose-5-phosphate reductoisomerase [Hornefia porci]|uniref:1-deoxy-D-xylulose 5-phosphate reductoisomerase n=1 Tax=Hornefia porci TaxID=2652292 RepID=A0A1Q9JES9_9FIRM|nr:1-deoxy-D-xylulose-5-phosphate reductoisomerase [Hornefia porci]OLR54699.1 1-deoxy-D-xylulose-5-phosphate reductoisomerase [Hornefia porci]
MKKVTILGSTGSIGTQALSVIDDNPGLFQIEALTCGRNTELFRRQIERYKPRLACCERREDAAELAWEFPGVSFVSGAEGLEEAAVSDCDILLNALMGMRGLVPTYRAIIAGHDIALANKETLVAGGAVIMNAVEENGVAMLPVDSEHSAIFQCLEGNRDKKIRRILLTASGGPFRDWPAEKLADVTPEMALQHPNWSMGRKITIDSATMMNKGLEMIEAMWLFGVGTDDIQVLIHPQSVVHSGVEFADRSVLTQMGVPDMKIPISVALGYPDRLETKGEALDFFGAASELTFRRPNPRVFRCLDLAVRAARAGGSCPVVLNAANEVLVQAFLDRRIRFTDIADGIERMLDRHERVEEPELEEILEIDGETRRETESSIC